MLQFCLQFTWNVELLVRSQVNYRKADLNLCNMHQENSLIYLIL